MISKQEALEYHKKGLLAKLGGATAIGPILLGIRKPVYLLTPGVEVNDIVNITAMAVFEAQLQADRSFNGRITS